MAYIVNPHHGPLSTPWGNWKEGERFIPNSKIPAATLAAWKAIGPKGWSVLIMDEEGPDVDEILADTDELTGMNRKTLLALIRLNNLHERTDGPQIRPAKSWPDEAIRQAIRDEYPDLLVLKMPDAVDDSIL